MANFFYETKPASGCCEPTDFPSDPLPFQRTMSTDPSPFQTTIPPHLSPFERTISLILHLSRGACIRSLTFPENHVSRSLTFHRTMSSIPHLSRGPCFPIPHLSRGQRTMFPDPSPFQRTMPMAWCSPGCPPLADGSASCDQRMARPRNDGRSAELASIAPNRLGGGEGDQKVRIFRIMRNGRHVSPRKG